MNLNPKMKNFPSTLAAACLLMTLCVACVDAQDKSRNSFLFGQVLSKEILSGKRLSFKLKSPNDQVYWVTINDMELSKKLNVGQKVGLESLVQQSESNHITAGKVLCMDCDTFHITGKVRALFFGKDGYTATIEGKGGRSYRATISFANLGDNHAKYRNYEIGENISVKGELWQVNGQLHVTVRDILK